MVMLFRESSTFVSTNSLSYQFLLQKEQLHLQNLCTNGFLGVIHVFVLVQSDRIIWDFFVGKYWIGLVFHVSEHPIHLQIATCPKQPYFSGKVLSSLSPLSFTSPLLSLSHPSPLSHWFLHSLSLTAKTGSSTTTRFRERQHKPIKKCQRHPRPSPRQRPTWRPQALLQGMVNDLAQKKNIVFPCFPVFRFTSHAIKERKIFTHAEDLPQVPLWGLLLDFAQTQQLND